MREMYLLAFGIVIGLVVRDYVESLERRIAYRAADQATENWDLRSRWRRQAPISDEDAPAGAPVATAAAPAT